MIFDRNRKPNFYRAGIQRLVIRPVVNNLDQMVFSQCIAKYLTFGEVENLDEDVVAVAAAAVAVAAWRLPVPI